MASARQDNETAPGFGPRGIGFDFLPLKASAADERSQPSAPARPLPVVALDSSGPLPPVSDHPSAIKSPPRTSRTLRSGGHASQQGSKQRTPGEFWLDGDVILLACPDCLAPMSVRFWLMVADCWRCGTSIELTEEHQRQIQELLDERERQQTAAPPPLPGRTAVAPPPAPGPPSTALSAPPPLPGPVRQAGRIAERPPPADLQQVAAAVQALRREPWLRHLLNETPAWLISMLVHLVLLTILALLTTENDRASGPFITLSSVVSRDVRDGGDTIEIKPDEMAQFDLPLPSKVDLSDDRQRKALLAAAADARELRLDDDTPNLPDLETIKTRVGRADGYEIALAARDPRLRVEIVTKEGGTTLTEAAVARGLRWLANHQNSDGSWSLKGFHRAGDCNCSGDGAFGTKSPGTALALLPYLGAGQTHLAGKYKGTVSRGLRWLIENQKENGDLRAGANGREGMYAHGQAAIVLCEAFAMTGDEELRVPAQLAINFIVRAQYRDGGWRYQPNERDKPSDTSVVGWQLMALQSARAANLTVPEEAWGMADLYLDGVQQREGALYSYQSRGGPTPPMTAEALLCRMYLGWTKERPALVRGVKWLSENHQPSAGETNIYYWYYATQVMHHYGGPQWETWNLRMREILVNSQATRGHAAGSWEPRGDQWGEAGGRIYMTALAVCTLEIYYRHLPIFRQIELGE